MMSGFPANSVFIVDSEDRVRHHTVLDPRLELFCFGDCGDDYKSLINPRTSWNLEEVARLVAAYRLCFPLILIVEKTFLSVQGHRWRAESCHGRLEGGGGHRGQPGVNPQHCHHCHFNLWQIPAIARFYATVYGDEEDAMEEPAATIFEVEGGSKAVGDHQVHKTSSWIDSDC